MEDSHAIAGISSGAALFCLERIAWDHGFRLTGRIQRFANGLDGDTPWQDVAAFLRVVLPLAAGSSALARDYRPSRSDGIVHAWVMEKSSPQFRQGRREV